MFLAHRRRPRHNDTATPPAAVSTEKQRRVRTTSTVFATVSVMCWFLLIGLDELHLLYKNAPTQMVILRLKEGDERSLGTDEDEWKNKLHFLIGGFPKCGTSTLRRALYSHKETSVSPTKRELCGYVSPTISNRDAFDVLDEEISSLSGGGKKIGLKCPSALMSGSSHGVERMKKHTPNLKLIIGVRHPVDWVQSFYNYRVREMHIRKPGESIPPFEQLMTPDSPPWMNFNLKRGRFELYLMQLGKTNITTDDMERLQEARLNIHKTNFSVFLYSADQMGDFNNTVRFSQFQQDMSNFLELKEPLSIVKSINVIPSNETFNETIDICQDEYKEIRQLLIRQGRETEEWIRTSFLESPDVTVSNRQHFLSSIAKWRDDPCDNPTERYWVDVE